MFRPMALTVLFALAGSLLLSLTYIPASLSFLLRRPVSERESRVMAVAVKRYPPLLSGVMRHRALAVGVAVALVVASAAAFPFLGSEFMPRLGEGAYAVEVLQLPGVSLTESLRAVSEMEKVLLRFPEVTRVVSKIGRAEVATDPMGVESTDLFVSLKPQSEWTSARTREELADKMAAALRRTVPQAVYSFSQPIEMRVSELIAGVRADIAIKVFGDDLETLRRSANEIRRVVADVRGATDVKVEQTAGLPQLRVVPSREALARYGLNVTDVNELVESLVVGREAGMVFEGEQRFPLVVKLKPEASRDVEAIRALPVRAGKARVPLSQLAEVEVVEGPSQISREGTRRRVAVELNVRGRDIGGFVQEARTAIEKGVTLPPGSYIRWGGEFENLQRASARLLVVVPVALFLIFVLLFTTFHSARQALVISSGIPFAIVGGVAFLALRGMPFSISAGVGFIALFGVAVLNGLVMVSEIDRLRALGTPVEEAVIAGAEARLRPVLMTALVASLGFVPMALATSAGAEVQRPLATVVIGGLVSSTALTLLLLPTIYAWFERERRGRRSPA